MHKHGICVYLQRLGSIRVGVVVQDDIVGHVEALPDTQMVKQGGLPAHITHVNNCNVWRERNDNTHQKDNILRAQNDFVLCFLCGWLHGIFLVMISQSPQSSGKTLTLCKGKGSKKTTEFLSGVVSLHIYTSQINVDLLFSLIFSRVFVLLLLIMRFLLLSDEPNFYHRVLSMSKIWHYFKYHWWKLGPLLAYFHFECRRKNYP